MLKKTECLNRNSFSQKQLDKWREKGKDVFLENFEKRLLNAAII